VGRRAASATANKSTSYIAIGAGAALSTAMIIAALCLRAAWQPASGWVWQRSLWMTLCALSKQPQIAFILAEFMPWRLKELPRRRASVTAVILPSVMLSPLWGRIS
jgi:hypothetical protein